MWEKPVFQDVLVQDEDPNTVLKGRGWVLGIIAKSSKHQIPFFPDAELLGLNI